MKEINYLLVKYFIYIQYERGVFMSKLNIQNRKFVIKAGMTVEDVKNSKDATKMQKKYASAFDTDGQKGFSQKEADLFNSTTFSEKADGSVIFWTRQVDGTKKGTKFSSNDNNIKYKLDVEVKPYVKKAVVKNNKVQTKAQSQVKPGDGYFANLARKAGMDGLADFLRDDWSGKQIAKVTGDTFITDWLQDKDKKCTDKKDDGKLSVLEVGGSLLKGLIGGIPKAIINHPVTSALAIGVGAAAVAVTGGAILPVLGAAGVITGVGMVGYGGYKAATAKTDGEAKQAFETIGLGVTTTVLSVASAEKTLNAASDAGVKSATVADDESCIDKTVQMFKSIPEALKVSKDFAKAKLSVSFPSTDASGSTNFANRKMILEREIKANLRKNVETGHLSKKYIEPNRIQNVIDAINEDNIDFATKLLSHDVEYYMTSNYAKFSEDNVNYILETVPRLLKSEDPTLRQAVEYIINNKDICDNIFTLDAVNEKNAAELMSLEATPKEKYMMYASDITREIPSGIETIQQKIWRIYAPKHQQPVARQLTFKNDFDKFNYLIRSNKLNPEQRKWIAEYIMSDDYTKMSQQ